MSNSSKRFHFDPTVYEVVGDSSMDDFISSEALKMSQKINDNFPYIPGYRLRYDFEKADNDPDSYKFVARNFRYEKIVRFEDE